MFDSVFKLLSYDNLGGIFPESGYFDITGGIYLLYHDQLFTTQTFKPFFRCDRALTIHCTMHVCACGLVAGAL